MKQLSPRQAAFVREYLVDLSPGRAAMRAGYAQTKSVYAHGAYLLRQPHIAHAVKEAMDDRAQRTQITADRVLQELAAVAFSDIGAVCAWKQHDITDEPPRKGDRRRYDTNVIVFDSSEVDPLARRSIKRIQRFEGGAVRFEMHDKLGALELLGKHLGLFAPKRVEVSGPDGGPVEVNTMELHHQMAQYLSDLSQSQRDRIRVALREIVNGPRD